MNKRTIRWLHEAWRTLTTITWDYLPFYTEKFTAFSLNSTIEKNSVSHIWIVHKCCTVCNIGKQTPTPSLFCSYIFSTRHKLNLQCKQQYIFNFVNPRIFCWKSNVNLRFSLCHLFAWFSVTVILSKWCWGFDKLQLVICSYRDWCYLWHNQMFDWITFTSCLRGWCCCCQFGLFRRCIHSNQINWWIFNTAAIRLRHTYFCINMMVLIN